MYEPPDGSDSYGQYGANNGMLVVRRPAATLVRYWLSSVLVYVAAILVASPVGVLCSALEVMGSNWHRINSGREVCLFACHVILLHAHCPMLQATKRDVSVLS